MSTQVAAEPTLSAPARRRFSLLPGPATWFTLAIYLATRLAVGIGVAVVAVTPHLPSRRLVPERWDAWWYIYLAQHGYGHSLHPQAVDFHRHFSQWAFFPLYPLAIRAVHWVTGAGWVTCGYVAANILGFFAVRAVYALGQEFAGDEVGRGAAVLFAAWPGSVLLSMPYSEGLFLTATAFALRELLRRRWVLAGSWAAVATATRPMGLAIVAAALCASAIALVRRHDWRSLAAPLLSVVGIGSFLLFSRIRMGDALIWRKAETYWHQKLDFSVGLPSTWAHEISTHSFRAPEAFTEIVGATLLVAFVLVLAWRVRRTPVALLCYTAVATAMIVGYSTVAPRPRMVLALVPGFVVLASLRRRWLVYPLAVAFSSLIALFTVLYLAFPGTVP